MDKYILCDECKSLIKNHIGDEKVRFNACCASCRIMFNGYSRPRIIKANTGPMLPINTPEWCPKNRGVTTQWISSDEFRNSIKSSSQVQQSSSNKENNNTLKQYVKKEYMTYTEKRDKMMTLPKHLKWEDIKEGEIYVIPKILYQTRKVIKVINKGDTFIRYSEIDGNGNETNYISSVYPKDIDMVFITKFLKF